MADPDPNAVAWHKPVDPSEIPVVEIVLLDGTEAPPMPGADEKLARLAAYGEGYEDGLAEGDGLWSPTLVWLTGVLFGFGLMVLYRLTQGANQ